MSAEYDNFEVEITDIQDRIDYYNFLVYADSGSGKTVFAGSDRKVLFLAPEKDGVISSKRMGSKAKEIRISHWEHLRKSVDWLEEHPEVLEEFDWLVIDSLTEMQKMCSLAILEVEAPERIAKDQDIDDLQLQDYKKLYTLMENLVRSCNDLPINVMYTALSRVAESPDGLEFLVPQIGSNQLKKYDFAMKIVATMTSYGHLRNEIIEVPAPTETDKNAVKQVKRRTIYWEDVANIRGKDRTTRLAPFTIVGNPTRSLEYVRRCADGDLVRNPEGKIVSKKAPAKKAVSKPVSAPKIEEVRTSPDSNDQVSLGENPANIPDDAMDLSDSVPRAPKGKEQETNNELVEVEA